MSTSSIVQRLKDHLYGAVFAACIASVLVTAGIGYAATSYDVQNVPDMRLTVRVSTTQTSNIKIAWPSRNGVQYAMPTATGVVLEFNQGTRVEHIYASTVVNDSATKTFTLSGSVIRNLDWNDCSSYVTEGNGQIFTPGAKVREVVDCRLLNRTVKTDRLTTTTGSGALKCGSTTQPCIFPGSYTTTQRDAFTFGNDLPSIIYNTTIGTMQYRSGGAWINFGSGASAVNATESIKGVVELGTVAEQIAATEFGSTLAPLVPQVKNLVRNSAGAADAGKIGILGANGAMTGSLLATNASTPVKNNSGSYVLAANQQYTQITPIGSMLMWPTDTAPSGYLLCYGQAVSRTTYAALFAVIGTTFGAGDTTTTFNLPDMRGRYALGQDDMGGSSANRVTDSQADTIGSGSGSLTATIAVGNLPSLTWKYRSGNGGGGSISALNINGSASFFQFTATNDIAEAPLTGVGANTPMRTIDPYLTFNYIIKY